MGLILIKDLLREIRKSFSRFFSIFAICLIGVAFFAGVSASSGDMKESANTYYKNTNLYDLRIVSSIGFDDVDVERIGQIDGVKDTFATVNLDALTYVTDLESVVRVSELPREDGINKLTLIKGRMPENPNECVIRVEMSQQMPELNSDITLKASEGDITEDLVNQTFKVVGYVYTPLYISYYLDQTNIGNGNVAYQIFTDGSNFKSEYYTDVYVTLNDSKKYNTYDKDYFDYVDSFKDEILSVGEARFGERIESLIGEVEQKRQERLSTVNDEIRLQVISNLTDVYQSYYPDTDVSSMIAPYIEQNYQNALQSFDYSLVNEPFDKAIEDIYDKAQNFTWKSLTRNELYSFVDYKQSSNRMGAIATVFPLFFILVAGLVSLTTIARLIDEQRGLIGTYKALGYSKSVITAKYVLYALIASVLGGVIGCAFGLKFFPFIIINAWNIIYQIPKIVYASHGLLSVISVLSLALTTVIVTVYVCINETSEVPSELLRPKSPVTGKKILLERITPIWNRLSFTMKVTLRNIFLYKKRLFMTILGIGGCGALILAGFGIKDSVQSIIDRQFNDILHYDLVVTLNEGIEDDQRIELDNDMSTNLVYTDYIKDYSYSGNIKGSKKSEKCNISVIGDAKEFKNYYTFRDRKSGKKYDLNDSGVILSEKLAKDLDLKVGDEFIMPDANGVAINVKVSNICETYVGHYLYISSSYYEKLTGEHLNPNTLLVKLPDSRDDTVSVVGNDLLKRDYIKGLSFVKTNRERFEKTIQSIDLVTVILIISAALLSFVVVFNLIDINVSERLREIATIKVLGFYDYEVAMYVYREITILTLIGGLLGLGLGVLLHSYIMTTIELEDVMFGTYKSLSSFIDAYLITIVFSFVISLVMYPRLSKIKMVESLKSIE